MKFLKKLWAFSTKAGLSLFILTIMFASSVSLVSLTQRGKIYYGKRCHSTLNEKAISYLNQEEVIAFDYELNCNTLYIDLTLDTSITIKNAKALLMRISSYYETINYIIDTQFTIKNENYIILASLVDKEITMSVTTI